MAVIGNGCSAAQVVPYVAQRDSKLTQGVRNLNFQCSLLNMTTHHKFGRYSRSAQ